MIAPQPTAGRPMGRWFGLMLIGLVLLGCALRIHHLGKKSLWADELFTLAIALYQPLVPEPGKPWFRHMSVLEISDGDTFWSVKAGEQSPPLQDLLEKASVQTFGNNEIAARLPGALAACGLLVWFAALAWRNRGDPWLRSVLGWSLLLLALSPGLIIFAKDGRAYSLGASLCGMAGLLWLLRWRHGWRRWQPPGWGEIALFTLACYTHYNAAALVALLLGADAVMATKNRSKTAWLRLLTLGAVFMVWIAVNARTIIFTTKGGVRWREISPWEYVSKALSDTVNVIHAPWLFLCLALLLGLLVGRLLRHRPWRWTATATAFCILLGIILVYLVLAAFIASRAGMYHPRYYGFVVPLAAVLMAMVLAELHRPWAVAAVGLVVVGLSQAPTLPGTEIATREEFREAAEFAVRGVDKDTLFVYPWGPNRNLYRIYLDRFLGEDSRPRLLAISGPDDLPRVCERLGNARHVVTLGHGSGKPRMDELYALCGARWPLRQHQGFHYTFAEHWRAAP